MLLSLTFKNVLENVFYTNSRRKTMATLNVRILRNDPNSINKSSQFVSVAKVRKETALIFEDFREGKITRENAKNQINVLSTSSGDQITVPFSVYLNVHDTHASVFFMKTDMKNRNSSDNIKETSELAGINHGLRIFFCNDSFKVINPVMVRRVDLFTEDGGHEYKIEINGHILKEGFYKMFKCYEIIGISDYDIEWAYLMAAQDWYDTAANNCLTYSKRFIRELHRHVMDNDLSEEEIKNLNELYISFPGESVFEKFRSRVSFFLAPSAQMMFLIAALIIFAAGYIEFRIRYIAGN